MKGILLAGGSGTRLHPLTQTTSKHLLPIFDKPMIYYSLSVLMLAGIREVLIIATSQDVERYESLFGNGEKFGMNIYYDVQPSPDGIAQAFIIGEEFIEDDNVCLVLGDNLFVGGQFSPLLKRASERKEGASVFAYHVRDPERFGVVEFDENHNAISIEEKPENPKSNFAVTGLYFYDNDVVEIAKKLKPSSRGELEITSVNQEYLKRGKLKVEILGRGFVWMDTGTCSSLYEAGSYIRNLEFHQGFKVACLEEIAYGMGWIDKEQLIENAKPLLKTAYGQYLMDLTQQTGRAF